MSSYVRGCAPDTPARVSEPRGFAAWFLSCGPAPNGPGHQKRTFAVGLRGFAAWFLRGPAPNGPGHQKLVVLTLALCVAATFTSHASADAPVGPASITTDAVVVRFHAPETGGAARPRYVTARALAYEARLVALELAPDVPEASAAYDERNVRAALDQVVAEEMLAKLPLEREPDVPTLDRVAELLRDATRERVGGATAFDRASAVEGLGPDEVQSILRRRARAAMYVDRVIGSVLRPSEEQLREVYRTTAHPYRAKRFDDCRDELTRWIVLERVRAAETAFLQSARSRVTIVYTGSVTAKK